MNSLNLDNPSFEIWQQKGKKAYKTEAQVIHHKNALQITNHTVQYLHSLFDK